MVDDEEPAGRLPQRQEKHEDTLRREIANFYLPKQLVDLIYDLGFIPKTLRETVVGVAFLDIADYTYLSKFLSPMENQTVLNGLYTAFNTAIQRHGGYLNKIEGDSLMFHVGGSIDPVTRDLDTPSALNYIARELFYVCVEMQRICEQFNQASDRFLEENTSDETRVALRSAFDIIETLRNVLGQSSSINALFQIQIRIGANIGEVTMGNFGPTGAKHWDVIGNAVIEAKRMESTAPIGGLRISRGMYEILERNHVVEEYYTRFRREAQVLFSRYRTVAPADVFRYSDVTLKDKRNAGFQTYSVQVNPRLPETVMKQVESLIEMGREGADRVLDLLRYYRGNRFVIDAIEEVFAARRVYLRKGYMLQLVFPKGYESLQAETGHGADVEQAAGSRFSLFEILEKLGRFQDIVKTEVQDADAPVMDRTYDELMRIEHEAIERRYETIRKMVAHQTYFHNVVFPLVFRSIRASIMEHQQTERPVEEIGE